MAAATRKMRAFKRWMKWQGIECSEALDLLLHPTTNGSESSFSVSVKTLCDLHDGDVVARIPKESCLTMKTSRARRVIEEAGLDGNLGLAFALMYERSLGPLSIWFVYLQLLPFSEPIPMLWTCQETDSLLTGTELHKIVKEDKVLVCEDWIECIQPLLVSASLELNAEFFGIEQYFAAKSLVASRSFAIDDYYGFGMVPLADLFNHKTGAEDVHFTSVSSGDESDNDMDNCERNNKQKNLMNDKSANENSLTENESFSGSDFELEYSSSSEDDPAVLQMVIVKDVKAGKEVFNTYGFLGNAALLHRYGFTEAENPYDLVNLDLELVLQWGSSLFSGRYIRRRLSLWRRLDYSGCVSQNSEYFEICFGGEPQIELLVLLYIILLPEEACQELDLVLSSMVDLNRSRGIFLSCKVNVALLEDCELNKELLLTKGVRGALLSIADMRESLYGSSSLEDDIEALNNCCRIKEPKLYHALQLRVSERRILEKFRSYASSRSHTPNTPKEYVNRIKVKRT